MYHVIIPHTEQGQKAIKFDTEDKATARGAALVGIACGVKTIITEEVKAKVVTFRNLPEVK